MRSIKSGTVPEDPRDVLAVFAVFCSKLSASDILIPAGILGADSSANERTATPGCSAAVF
jgi:hypothetical protein